MLPMGKISPAVSRLLNVSRHTASLRGGILAFGARRTTPEDRFSNRIVME